MGNPFERFMGGNQAVPQQQAPYRSGGGQQQELVAQLLAKEEERQKAEKEKALKLLGVGVMLGKAMGQSGGGSPASGGGGAKPGAKSSPAASRVTTGGNGGSGPVSSSAAKSSPVSRRDRGAAASKPAMQAAMDGTSDSAKVFPMAMMAPAAAGASGGFMASPMAGAAVAGGLDLVGGLINGGGDQEEMAKRQLRQQGQQNLGQGIRSMAEMLRSRNVEMRSVLANLGR